MDYHLTDPDIHLAGVSDIRAIEIYQPLLQNLLCFVHPRVASHFYHTVVDLSQVYLMHYLVCSFAASAALSSFVLCEFSAVRGSV